MKRTAKDKSLPRPKPVQRIEVSDKHTGLRIACFVICILFAVVAMSYAVYRLVTKPSGWTTIEAAVTGEENCTGELLLQYDIGLREDMSTTTEYKQIAELYSNLCSEAYRIFQSDEEYAGTDEAPAANLAYLNKHVNEVVTVDPALYAAFELIRDCGSRYPFLAPVYAEYSGIFSCENDGEAEEFDPMHNADVSKFINDVLKYVNDSEAINIEFLGDNKVRLNVSDGYAEFASQNNIGEYLDFFWLKNAFVVDYIAEKLAENSFVHGTITTYDGYTRHLGGAGMALSLNFFDNSDGRGIPAAQLDFKTAQNAVYFRNYENSGLDTLHFYTYANGEVRNPYIDPEDGMSKASKSDLMLYSDELGCAEIALAGYGLYAADSFDAAAVISSAKNGVYALYCDGTEVCFTDAEATLSHLYNEDGVSYSAKHVS